MAKKKVAKKAVKKVKRLTNELAKEIKQADIKPVFTRRKVTKIPHFSWIEVQWGRANDVRLLIRYDAELGLVETFKPGDKKTLYISWEQIVDVWGKLESPPIHSGQSNVTPITG